VLARLNAHAYARTGNLLIKILPADFFYNILNVQPSILQSQKNFEKRVFVNIIFSLQGFLTKLKTS